MCAPASQNTTNTKVTRPGFPTHEHGIKVRPKPKPKTHRLAGQRKVNNRCSLARHSNSVARSLASLAAIQLTHDALVAGLVAGPRPQDVVRVDDARDDNEEDRREGLPTTHQSSVFIAAGPGRVGVRASDFLCRRFTRVVGRRSGS